MWSRRSLAIALVLPLLAGCSAFEGQTAESRARGIRIVTSFYPLQYITQRIAGDSAEVANLTHPGQEPHDLELGVRQTADLASADLVVYERGFQAAVDDAVDQNGPDNVVDVSAAVHLHGSDPHFWLDPRRLSSAATAVERGLVRAYPKHRSDYARNLRSLQHDLAALDASYRRGLASCRIRTLVASHDAFGYLGQRYGLQVVGINGLSPDAEPSPAHIKQLQQLIERDHITTVFSEELASPKLADSLAHDLGLQTAVLDPIEGLTNATATQNYLSLMRRDLVALKRANRCA